MVKSKIYACISNNITKSIWITYIFKMMIRKWHIKFGSSEWESNPISRGYEPCMIIFKKKSDGDYLKKSVSLRCVEF